MRVVDTSAWLEWLSDSALGRRVGVELPAREFWIVPTIVQYELARLLAREASEDAADDTIAFSSNASDSRTPSWRLGGGNRRGQRALDG